MQFFTYISSNQLQILFNDIFLTKLLNGMFILLLFVFLQVALVLVMLLNYLYKRHSIYFLQNSKSTLLGLFLLITTKSIRNMLIALISSFMSSSYEKLIFALVLVEVVYLLFITISMMKYKVFRQKVRFGMQWVFCLFRIAIQIGFWVFYNNSS